MSIKNKFYSLKNFILKNKSIIIVSIILVLSMVSLIIQNSKESSAITINEEELQKEKYEGKIAVYISGEVKNPGVYYIDEESRVVDLIDLCGGFTQEADISDLNLAEKLSDAEKIDVPKIILESDQSINEENMEESIISNEEDNTGLININTASKEELKELKGVGDTLANNIIEYRSHTKFESIEDILNVSGIGDAKFEAIREYICVD